MTRRVALKVAYDGTRFHGSQRQPDVRTVEGDLLSALRAVGAVHAVAETRFGAAGRTDAGVSAAGNVFAFDTSFPLESLPRAVNARLRDAWAWAAAEVPDDFRARVARGRAYRYFLPADGVDADALDGALRLFVGEHDFSVFCRPDARGSRVRRIDRIRLESDGPFLAATFEAPSFLWNQIRRIMEAARRVAAGTTDPDTVREALRTGKGPDLGLAPPEPLVLLDVRYDFPLTPDPGVVRHAADALRRRILARHTANAIDRTFLDAMGVPP